MIERRYLHVKLRDDQRERLSCNSCGNIMRDPVDVRGCGHSHCEACLSNLSVNDIVTDIVTCDSCRSSEKTFMSSSLNVRTEILGLNVICMDCEWSGTVAEYTSSHAMSCGMTRCKANVKTMRTRYCMFEGTSESVAIHQLKCFWCTEDGQHHILKNEDLLKMIDANHSLEIHDMKLKVEYLQNRIQELTRTVDKPT